MSKFNILFQLTGSIACYKSCQIISQLVKAGHQVKTVCSQAALKFIGPATLEGLTGNPVYSDIFAKTFSIEHVNLNKWLDLAIICPATGNIINKLARGIADDLIGNLFLAHDFKKPYIIAPAMNKNMYQHPATIASINILREWGIKVLPTDEGHQACGDIGPGRLLSPEEIYQQIITALEKL